MWNYWVVAPKRRQSNGASVGIRLPLMGDCLNGNFHRISDSVCIRFCSYFCKKRFAALEFVRSHVEAAHRDRLEEAKWRALCFNAYLADPKRPFFIQNAADEEDRIGIVGEAVGNQPVQ